MISSTPGCLHPLQARLVPTLVSILNDTSGKVSPGLQSVALDVLMTLVRASQQPPLSDLLMCSAFPAAVDCTLRTDDNSILQVGKNNSEELGIRGNFRLMGIYIFSRKRHRRRQLLRPCQIIRL